MQQKKDFMNSWRLCRIAKFEAANRFLECLAGKACDALMQAFPDVPEDDEPVTEEDLRDIEEGRKAVAEGRVESLGSKSTGSLTYEACT